MISLRSIRVWLGWRVCSVHGWSRTRTRECRECNAEAYRALIGRRSPTDKLHWEQAP